MDRWHDQWRFTSTSAYRLFEEVFGSGGVQVEPRGNLCAAVNFLDGRAAGELGTAELEHVDPDYELVIFIRAVKA
jgi:hypothetical protein